MTKRWLRRAVPMVGLVALVAACSKPFDFDGDGKADPVMQLANGDWRDVTKPPTDPPLFDGQAGDADVAADYDGDGRTDAAVIRGDQWITSGSRGTITFPPPAQLPAFAGSQWAHMVPVPADYDGDRRADLAWYRDSDATWFIEGREPITFGRGPTDVDAVAPQPWNDRVDQDMPVPADYDGDHRADLATYNARTHRWDVKGSRDGAVSTVTMPGSNGEPWWPVPGDYDGVGHAQRALFGPLGWRIDGHVDAIAFSDQSNAGTGLLYPAVGDYDGDGRTDLSYVSPSGLWRTRSSADPTVVTSRTVEPYRTSSGAHAVTFGAAQLLNVARLTLIGKSCWPGTFDYPKNC